MRNMRLVLVLTGFTMTAGPLFAEVAADPSGHWQGAVQLPSGEVSVEIDLSRGPGGTFTGTLNTPGEHIKGVPLQTVAVDGTAIRFQTRRDQPFAATLSADGKAMFGEYTIAGYTLPFSMSRTGEAEVIERPSSRPIAKELEGAWNGVLSIEGRSMRLRLMLSNRTDGTASGQVVSLDEGGLELPVTIAQDGATVTITSTITGWVFSATRAADGRELNGTFTQGERSLPLTLRAANQ